MAKRYYDECAAASPDGAAPAALARAWLRAHAWWANAAPRLPSWANAIGAALFVVADPGPTAAPVGDAPLPVRGALAAASRLLDAGGTWRGGSGGGASSSDSTSGAGAEGALLAGACGVLWLVLQRRRAVRARRAATVDGEGAAPGQEPPAEAAAAAAAE
jgi:hypothetical protein